MIRLIASDLDGTLLYGRNNTVSEEMFALIKEMKEKGILFAAASGRQYYNLKKLFAPVWEDMAFICENGAVVYYQDQILAQQVIPREELMELIGVIDAEEQAEVLLSSATTSYIRPKTEEYIEVLRRLGNHVTILKEWEDVAEPCVKVAWYEKGAGKERMEHWNAKIKPPARVVTSGFDWLDVLYPNSHKGVGMAVLLEHLGFKKEETAAFGDNYNDIEMLEAVGYPIAMNSGAEAVKQLCPYHTDRVEDAVRKILDGTFFENSI